MQTEVMKKAQESGCIRRLYMVRNAEFDFREAELEGREKVLAEREKSIQTVYSEKIAKADELKKDI